MISYRNRGIIEEYIMKKDGFYYNKQGHLMDEHFQILCYIKEYENNGDRIWFSKIVDLLKDKFTMSQISNAQDRLYDCGALDMKYEKVGKYWTCCWKLEPEAESFIQQIIDV